MLSLISAMSASFVAVAVVHKSWRYQSKAALYAGVVMFLASCFAWSFSQGWEIGLVYATCVPGLLVWPFIMGNRVTLPSTTNLPAPRKIAVSITLVAKHAGDGLVVLVGLMITSILIALAISLRLPFAESGQLAMGIVLLPMIWGGLVYHYLATGTKCKALAVYLVLSVSSALMLIYLPGLGE